MNNTHHSTLENVVFDATNDVMMQRRRAFKNKALGRDWIFGNKKTIVGRDKLITLLHTSELLKSRHPNISYPFVERTLDMPLYYEIVPGKPAKDKYVVIRQVGEDKYSITKSTNAELMNRFLSAQY